ncbi:phosphatidate cytidylyltransferase [Celeribacter arenosi]|uniref:Phosphatidate cytidylyltransferase n=1 Tax=Celeribacter arenosi TaxID=792649 RepID=A0ABP7KFS7_9RHOB
MSRIRDRWGDLGVRVTSAFVMFLIGLAALLISKWTFFALACLIVVVGVWELVCMARATSAVGGIGQSDVLWLVAYGILLCVGALGLIGLRFAFGISGVAMIIALVVVTDTLGYFVGRALGGAKFWPRISPKKTWAGILGGWAGAAILALIVAPLMDLKIALWVAVIGAMALSFASQMGDIFESALKRRMGVKDSSNLIPGHGGVLDRFDALIAVGALVFLMGLM